MSNQRSSARGTKRRGERGATATEYGVLMAFVAMAIVLGVTAFGGAVNSLFEGFAAFVADNF